MKKAVCIALALLLLLPGCGKEQLLPMDGIELDENIEDAVSAEASSSQQSAVTTILITDEVYGDISISYPNDNAGIAVTLAEGADTLDVLNEEIDVEYLMTYQKAHIKGEGYNILIGYKDYTVDSTKTYDATYYTRRRFDVERNISYDSVDGYIYIDDICMYIFPAATQYGARVVAIYPDEMISSSFLEDWEFLMEIPELKDILNSLEFSGMKDEVRWETETKDTPYFTVTPTDGWEFFGEWGISSLRLKKENMSDWSTSNNGAAEIRIDSWGLQTPQEWIDDAVNTPVDRGQSQGENILINGREFLVVEYSSQVLESYELVTTTGTEFDPESDDLIVITVYYIYDIEDVMSMLENIVIK